VLYAPLAVKRLVAAVCVFRPDAAKPNRSERVSRRGPRRGSGAGLDAGASGDYRAWPSKDGKPQRPDAGQGSGSRAAPTREVSLAMGSLPQRPDPRHTARRVKDHLNNNPLRSGRGLGAPSPQRERLTTPALPGASVPVLHAQCLLPTPKVRGELSKYPQMVLQSYG
jgi:hypothetical protein